LMAKPGGVSPQVVGIMVPSARVYADQIWFSKAPRAAGMLPGNCVNGLMNTEPGGVGSPDGFRLGVPGCLPVIPVSAKVPSFVGRPPSPIGLSGELGSDGGSAHATSASGTDRAPAAITASNAFLIMFVPPSLLWRNDGTESDYAFRDGNRRSRAVRRTQ
jgi:hypothetical protein